MSVGLEFKDRQLKFLTKRKLLSELELTTGQETAKAKSVISDIVSGLAFET